MTKEGVRMQHPRAFGQEIPNSIRVTCREIADSIRDLGEGRVQRVDVTGCDG